MPGLRQDYCSKANIPLVLSKHGFLWKHPYTVSILSQDTQIHVPRGVPDFLISLQSAFHHLIPLDTGINNSLRHLFDCLPLNNRCSWHWNKYSVWHLFDYLPLNDRCSSVSITEQEIKGNICLQCDSYRILIKLPVLLSVTRSHFTAYIVQKDITRFSFHFVKQ